MVDETSELVGWNEPHPAGAEPVGVEASSSSPESPSTKFCANEASFHSRAARASELADWGPLGAAKSSPNGSASALSPVDLDGVDWKLPHASSCKSGISGRENAKGEQISSRRRHQKLNSS